MTSELIVRLRGKQVATLSRGAGGSMQLRYLDAAQRGDRISVALPVRTDAYSDAACRNVLDWVLPERGVRTNIAQRIHADPSDTFALLAGYGRECAGALQFVAPDATDEAPTVRWLDDDEFARRVADLATHPFLSLDEDDVELSLGGVQEKALVVVEEGRIGLPLHGAISTHIVKPDISDRLRSVLAEFVALQLARAVGVPAARPTLRRVADRWVLFVERFDRLRDATGQVTREHHETAAQALCVGPAAKYELRGGPGVPALGRLVRETSVAVARDMQRLARLIMFNALIGNADAHAGNYGLMLYADGSVRLSPAYDLVPVRAVLGRDPKGYAMRIGGSYTFGDLDEQRMRGLARELDVASGGVVAMWRELREQVVEQVRIVADELRERHEFSPEDDEQLGIIVDDILGRAR